MKAQAKTAGVVGTGAEGEPMKEPFVTKEKLEEAEAEKETETEESEN